MLTGCAGCEPRWPTRWPWPNSPASRRSTGRWGTPRCTTGSRTQTWPPSWPTGLALSQAEPTKPARTTACSPAPAHGRGSDNERPRAHHPFQRPRHARPHSRRLRPTHGRHLRTDLDDWAWLLEHLHGWLTNTRPDTGNDYRAFVADRYGPAGGPTLSDVCWMLAAMSFRMRVLASGEDQ